ncbi:peptidoglycan DD-metalloendopeptidase family protein, partial [Arthrobacter sp. CP30]
MNASLAMVVCFVGFQGIVPQSWEAASAVGPDDSRMTLSALIGDDSLSPTGTVGESLLTPFGTGDTLDPVTFAPEPDAVPATAGADASEALSVQAVKHPAAGSLFAPLDELTPTSSFGFRTSPISGQPGEFHTGQDYSAPCGTPVFAADAGTVRAVGWHPWGGGNRVEVDHGNGLITTYNHLQGISVLEGDTVNGGDPIAELGTTGSSTGCHLHFETILDGEHVDPLRWSFVPTSHGERTGEVKDYTPGDVGASDIPAWAQSSTRSDQQPPVLESDILPVASGQDLGSALVDGLVPEAAAEPPTSVPPVAKPGSPVTSKPARPADSKPTASATPKPTASATPKPTASATPKPTASATPKPTASATPKPTASATPKP